jgi:GDP-mannose transporter
MFTSSLVGGWSDVSFNAIGYAWMLMNCFSAAAFVLKLRGAMKALQFKDLDTLYYNNAITLPIFVIMGLVTENWGDFVEYYAMDEHAEERWNLAYALLFSGIVAFYISFASAWCIRVTSSTTYSLTGALNKIPMAILGMVFFNDVVTLKGLFAIVMGLFAGIVYTYAKQLQKKQGMSGEFKTSLPTVSTTFLGEKSILKQI